MSEREPLLLQAKRLDQANDDFGQSEPVSVPVADFMLLTKIPIVLYYGKGETPVVELPGRRFRTMVPRLGRLVPPQAKAPPMPGLFDGSLLVAGYEVSPAEAELLTVHAETIAAVQKVLLAPRDRAIVRLLNQLCGRKMTLAEFTGKVSLTVGRASAREWVFGVRFETRKKKRTRLGRERGFVELTLRTRRGQGDPHADNTGDRHALDELAPDGPVGLAFTHADRAYRVSCCEAYRA